MSLPASLRASLAPAMRRAEAGWQRAAAWYRQRPPREQRLLAAAAAVAALALLFLVLIEPAWSAMRQAQRDLPALRVQAATVADLTAQVRAMQRHGAGSAAPAMPTAEELSASLRREGLPDEAWTLAAPAKSAGAAPEPGVTLSLREAPSSALFRWLDTAARDWRLSVAQAELTRATNPAGRRLPGRLSGTLTLRPAAPAS
ncbi:MULTISPECIES: type II secretion system protein GspM [Bordetella]|uniref:General secretion pathway protein GspM n=1 Tax=Bordetella genomosp. 2 TaxID=1983456 RepID=A0A261VW48_9BORD|nr:MULTISPECIES: type II secretion system protein GspM [Bordetella]OZI78336.1 hypothetical protein CAL24_09420 [Bordetella genomosp. 2]